MIDDPGLVSSEYEDPSRLETRIAIYGRSGDRCGLRAGDGRSGGRLVAATFSERNLAELWDAIGDDTPRSHGFTAQNGAAQLRGRFGRVDERVVPWQIELADRAELKALIAATIRRSHLADRAEHVGLPFTATAWHAVFVATQ